MKSFFLLFTLIVLVPAFSFAQGTVKEAEQLDFAQGLLSRGMYDMAILQCQKFIADYPHSPSLQEAYLSLGEGYFLSQDFKNAVDVFSQFIQRYPNSDQLPISLLRLGQIDIQQKKYDEALKELTSIDLQKKLKSPMLQSFDFYIAQAYLGQSDAPDAKQYFQKATQVEGASVYTPYAFEEIGKIEAQDAQYNESMGDFMQAIKATQDETLKGELTYRIAEDDFWAGKYPEAIKEFGEVLDHYPHEDFSQNALANMLLAYFNLGEYDQLLKIYQTKFRQTNDDAAHFSIYFAAVGANIELKGYNQANALLDHVLAFSTLKPYQRAKIFIKKADILIREGRYKDAMSLLDGYSSQDIDDADESFFLRAQAYYGTGDYDHAFNFFENVYLNFPNSRYSKAALLGEAHARQKAGRFKESEVLFLKYYNIQDDPELKSEALYDAVMMAVSEGSISQIISSAQEYLKAFPTGHEYGEVLLILADSYGKNNQPQEAISLLKDYMTKNSSLQRPNAVYFLLGFNEQLLGNSDQALNAYSHVDAHKEAGEFYTASIKNMAIIYLTQRKLEEARVYFDRLISQGDKEDLQVKTYIWVCNEYLREQKYDDVLRVAGQAEKRFSPPDLLEIYYFKAEALRGLGRCAQAVKDYDLVTASPDKNAFTGSAHIGDGLCLENAKKFDQARQEFQKSLDENAVDTTVTIHATFEMANLESSQGNLDVALKYYLLVATIYDDDHFCSESLLRAAKILEQLHRKDDALKMYSEILDKYKNSPAALEAKGRLGIIK